MKYLLSTGSLYTLGLDRALELATTCGFDGVELLVNRAFKTVTLDEAAALARRHDVRIETVHAPFHSVQLWGMDYWSMARRCIGFAREQGATLVNVHPNAYRLLRGRGLRKFEAEVAAAREACGDDVTLTLENMPFNNRGLFRWREFFNDAASLAEFARRTGVMLTLDTAHLGTYGLDIIEAFRAAADRVANIHVSDYGDGTEHLLPGAGGLPLGELLAEASGSDALRFITLESCPHRGFGAEFPANAEPELRRALEFMRTHA